MATELLLSAYRKLVRDGELSKLTEIQRIRGGENAWHLYGLSTSAYENDFAEFIYPHPDFKHFVRWKRSINGTCNVIDFMGPLDSFVSKMKPDFGVAVTLNDFRCQTVKEADTLNNLYVVPGNILNKHTWGSVELVRGDKLFDVAVVRPAGGTYDRVCLGVANVYYALIRKAYQILSPNDGDLFIDLFGAKGIPRFASNLRTFQSVFQDQNIGINIKNDGSGEYQVHITKHQNSAKIMPVFEM